MGKKEIFLREYETCQQQINSVGSQVWQATTIFLTVNTLVLAYIFQREQYSLDRLFLMIIIGVLFILILIKWRNWLSRQAFIQRATYERMREIETTLGMWRNRYVFLADGLESKKEDEKISEQDLSRLPKDRIDSINRIRRFYSRAAGFIGLKYITVILIIAWGLLIIREGVNCFYPEFYQCLLSII